MQRSLWVSVELSFSLTVLVRLFKRPPCPTHVHMHTHTCRHTSTHVHYTAHSRTLLQSYKRTPLAYHTYHKHVQPQTRACTLTCMHKCTHIHAHVLVHICTHAHACMCTRACTHLLAHMRTHTHTHSLLWQEGLTSLASCPGYYSRLFTTLPASALALHPCSCAVAHLPPRGQKDPLKPVESGIMMPPR